MDDEASRSEASAGLSGPGPAWAAPPLNRADAFS
jgi:hypothetical protein